MTSGGKPPAAKILQDLLTEKYHVAHTPAGEPFAVDMANAPSVMIRLAGRDGLRQRLTTDFVRKTGNTPNTQAMAEVLSLAEAIAMRGHEGTPHLRIAPFGGAIYLDLGRRDGQAVEISPAGWRVVQNPPVLFARTVMTAQLPLPAEDGSLEVARSLLNIGGADEWALYVACRIASLMPGITHPVELLTGQPGTAKTTATRLTSGWVDPSPVMIPMPRDGRTWASCAASSYVLPVDNVSWIPPWWSDLLCKAASGDGWIDRALYTDGDVYLAKFQSVVVLNGIDFGSIRGDLADRSVVHTLAKPSRYVSDDEITGAWDAAHPEALAWLLDRTVEVMRTMLTMPQTDGSDRLARFHQVVQAVDLTWRTSARQCWRQGKYDMLEQVADSDQISVAVRNAVTQPWEGTATELLTLLEMRGGLQPPEKARSWTPRMVSEKLARAEGALTSLGWNIMRGVRDPSSRVKKIILAPPGWAETGYPNGHSETFR